MKQLIIENTQKKINIPKLFCQQFNKAVIKVIAKVYSFKLITQLNSEIVRET